jgi:pimeloyl-ACP methyl ester carboxylesterase
MGAAFRQGGIGLKTDLQLITKNWNFLPESIEVPVYWWHGERDNLASPAAAKELAKKIPSCEPHFVPACGHFIHRDPVIAQKILDRLLAAPVF